MNKFLIVPLFFLVLLCGCTLQRGQGLVGNTTLNETVWESNCPEIVLEPFNDYYFNQAGCRSFCKSLGNSWGFYDFSIPSGSHISQCYCFWGNNNFWAIFEFECMGVYEPVREAMNFLCGDGEVFEEGLFVETKNDLCSKECRKRGLSYNNITDENNRFGVWSSIPFDSSFSCACSGDYFLSDCSINEDGSDMICESGDFR